MTTALTLGEVIIEVIRKDIKNIHLGVYPPDGHVKISAPSRLSIDTIRAFAISRLRWIRQQQTKLRAQEREPPREYLDRESHYVWGKRYLMKIIESDHFTAIETSHSRLILRVRPCTSETRKRETVEHWYRDLIKQAAPPFISQWEDKLGVKINRFYVQRMKTKWGSCNPTAATIRLNTQLATRRPACLQYVILHEMAHLLERHHNDNFMRILDSCLPNRRATRQSLNELPLVSPVDYNQDRRSEAYSSPPPKTSK